MKSAKGDAGRLAGGSAGGRSNLPAVPAAGAYPSAGRISAAAKQGHAPAVVVVREPWAAKGACTIEELVNWAFGPQRVAASPVSGLCEIEALAAGYAWQGTSSDGIAAVERIAAVGCRIDMSGPGRDLAHPVAELVAHVVALHPEGEIVREWAKLGVRPGGWDARPRFVPMDLDSKGDAVWVWDEASLPKRTGQQCPVMLMNSPEAVQAARRMYVRWFDALGDVFVDVCCREGLPFQLRPTRAKRTPWFEVSICAEK
jgi:hypothetical protein